MQPIENNLNGEIKFDESNKPNLDKISNSCKTGQKFIPEQESESKSKPREFSPLLFFSPL